MGKKKTIIDLLVERELKGEQFDKLIDLIEEILLRSNDLLMGGIHDLVIDNVDENNVIHQDKILKLIKEQMNQDNIESVIVENLKNELDDISYELEEVDDFIDNLESNLERENVDDFIEEISNEANEIVSYHPNDNHKIDKFLDKLARLDIDKIFPKD